MVEFVMPSCAELLGQLRAQREAAAALFDEEGWSAGARKLIERMDRLIARYGG